MRRSILHQFAPGLPGSVWRVHVIEESDSVLAREAPRWSEREGDVVPTARGETERYEPPGEGGDAGVHVPPGDGCECCDAAKRQMGGETFGGESSAGDLGPGGLGERKESCSARIASDSAVRRLTEVWRLQASSDRLECGRGLP